MKEKKNTSWKEAIHNPKNRAIVFFAFYFVFFAVLIVMIRTSPAPEEKPRPSSTPLSSPVVTEDVKLQSNCLFTYDVQTSLDTAFYEGKMTDHKRSFTMLRDGHTSSWYQVGDYFFREQDGRYQQATSPFVLSDFLDLSLLEDLLTFLIHSEEGNVETYEIDAVDIYQTYFNDEAYDSFAISELPSDSITVTREDGMITKVVYDFSHFIAYYATLHHFDDPHFVITLTFSSFGTVEDFTFDTTN